MSKKLVFLHIPKTAGLSVRAQLSRAFGRERVRVAGGQAIIGKLPEKYWQFPPDIEAFDVFTGHLDWSELEARIPGPRCVFTVLREPRERIASRYFHEKRREPRLSGPQREALALSPDDYFTNPNVSTRHIIDAANNNYQTRYLANRGPGGAYPESAAEIDALLTKAVDNVRSLQLVCTINQLHLVEQLLLREFDKKIKLTEAFHNAHDLPREVSRYQQLLTMVNGKTRDRLEEFVAIDDRLLKTLDLERQAAGRQAAA